MATPAKLVTIHADSRESRCGIATELARFNGVTVEQAELPSGDYLIGGGIAVERKSADDFVLSVMDGRLFDQIARMLNEHTQAVVLVEGNPYAVRSAIPAESIDGALSYVSLLSGAAFAFSPSLEATPRILWRMALHAQHGLGYEIPLRVAKPKPAGILGQYLVEGLPGVGPAMAKRLLAHFGSARAVFAADLGALCAVKGVGQKSAEAILAALDYRLS
jgi:Fanconi anemia group M protein